MKNTPQDKLYTQNQVDELLAKQRATTEHQTARLGRLVLESRLSRALAANGAAPNALSTAAASLADCATLEIDEDGEHITVRLEGRTYDATRLDDAAKSFLDAKSFYRAENSAPKTAPTPTPPTKSGGSRDRSFDGRPFEEMSATDLMAVGLDS